MKLSTSQANAYFVKPDTNAAGALIFGADPMRIALKRQQLISKLLGPAGEEEMRLTRLPASDLRKDPALLTDALKAVGFFPGLRVALVEDANEAVGPIITQSLAEWATGDAQIIVTAGALKPTSKLRKAFEAHTKTYATAIYDNPPTRAEIENDLKNSGINLPPQDVMHMLMDLAKVLEPGDFRQTLEKIGLYKLNDDKPLSANDISNCAPTSFEADVDDILIVVGDGQASAIGPVNATTTSSRR